MDPEPPPEPGHVPGEAGSPGLSPRLVTGADLQEEDVLVYTQRGLCV